MRHSQSISGNSHDSSVLKIIHEDQSQETRGRSFDLDKSAGNLLLLIHDYRSLVNAVNSMQIKQLRHRY